MDEMEDVAKGWVAPGLELVKEVFLDNLVMGVELGAGFAVVRDGEVLVDLVGGFSDAGATESWTPETLVNLYSTSKGLTALLIAQLVAEGTLDLDGRVTDVWPEFAAAGKGEVTIAQLLSHQAGLAGLRDPVTLEDLYEHDALAARLAAAEPLWPPGGGMGYHPILWGVLARELIERATDQPFSALFAERIAGPAEADVHFGLRDADLGRVADLVGPNRPWCEAPGITDAEPVDRGVSEFDEIVNQNPLIRPYKDACSAEWRRAVLPAANAHGTAMGLARIYGGAVASSDPLVPLKGLEAATREVVGPEVEDKILVGRRFRRSAAGFTLNHEAMYGPNPAAFGHDGAGGSFGFADPGRRMGVGYAMNQMQVHPTADARGERLIAALYECLPD
jgi:CubicO group peptidase (beta-lactamase class C family)